jgi:hypothetical protein
MAQSEVYQKPWPGSNYSDYPGTGYPATQSTYRFQTQNGSVFSPNGVRQIRIPLKASSGHLSPQESVLMFDVVAGIGVDAFRLQQSAHSLFSRYILRGPNDQIIDDIENFGQVAALWGHHQISRQHRSTTGAMLSGYGEELYLSSLPSKPYAFVGGADEREEYRVPTWQDYEGYSASFGPGGETVRFCLPLPGLLSTARYLPLPYMGEGLTIELHLANTNEAMASFAQNANVEYEIRRPIFLGTMINFDRRYEADLEVQLAMGINIHAPTWSTMRRNVQGGEYEIDIPQRSSSIKSLFVMQQITAQLTSINTNVDRTTSFVWAGNSEYQFKVGGHSVPETPVSVYYGQVVPREGSVEAYYELMKALGHSAHEFKLGTAVTKRNFMEDSWKPEFATADPGSVANLKLNGADNYSNYPVVVPNFVMAVDLEAFTRSNVQSGLDNKRNHLNISFNTKRPIATTANTQGQALTVIVAALVDQTVTISAGDMGSMMVVSN